MDEVRKKYGTSSIGFGAVMQNDIGASVRGDLLESESIKQKKNADRASDACLDHEDP